MKAIPYISFNGDCEEAVRFYNAILGGTLEILTFRDMPPDPAMPVSETWKNKVMHASIRFDDGNYLYFSDSWEGSAFRKGDNITVHLEVPSEEAVYDIVKKMAEGGKITMNAQKTFWNSVYGSLVDKFGILWGIEFSIPG